MKNFDENKKIKEAVSNALIFIGISLIVYFIFLILDSISSPIKDKNLIELWGRLQGMLIIILFNVFKIKGD